MKGNSLGKAQGKSSFCEQKEAKKLCHQVHDEQCKCAHRPNIDKSFLLLFSKKEVFLPPITNKA